VADGDVPGGTGTGGNATGGDGEESVWLDLIARFGAPSPADGESPWPDREDLAGPVRVTPTMGPTPDAMPADAMPGEPPTNPTGLPGLPVKPPIPGDPWPYQPSAVGTGPRDAPRPANPADEHYTPPEPPPLPKLAPATKLAWIALFGGPLYLLISTALGATISALTAFLAVGAFVGGFVVIVLRMDNGRPPDSGPDDGAVV
jgi:hypothetical protein